MRFRTRLNESGERIVAGSLGHIYEHNSAKGLWALLFLAPANSRDKDKLIRSRKRRALEEGFKLILDCEVEAIFLFPSNDRKMASFAARLVGVRPKPRQSPGQLRNLCRGPEREA